MKRLISSLFAAAALDISGATVASASPALRRGSRLIEFNDPQCDRRAALGCLVL
jgi:hypothetical protein